jgi:copper homeostasis protein CutC
MKIAELLSKKNAKVNVRVPAPRRKEVGGAAELTGRIREIRRKGTVLQVLVSVPRKGDFVFRPQDLTLAE